MRLRALCLAASLLATASTFAATFTVNDAGDAGDATPGNGVCATAGAVCTFRAALQEANALAGPDIIQFSIGSGPQTISPATPLPIASSLTLDATTQPGSGSGPRILIDGGNSVTAGLEFSIVSSLNVIIRGLAIGRFTGAGIQAYASSSTVTIERCYIGVGLDGVTDLGNGDGIFVRLALGTHSQLVIGNATGGGNVISGNQDVAVEIVDDPSGSKLTAFTVQGNIIGLGPDGMTQLANLGGGIRTKLQFGTVTFGGSPAARNIISGNGGMAYDTNGFLQADSFLITGNYIGVAADGVTPRGNGGGGLDLVGRTYTVTSNIISSNGGTGITFSTPTSSPSVILGNRIGGNSGSGINWTAGTNAVVGGPGSDQNIIAGNGAAGIRVSNGQLEIDANSIVANGQLGIDLGLANVVDANDALDADTGLGNNVQNRPTVVSAVRAGALTVIGGTLSSAAASTYRIRLFSSTAADPTGFGQGETYLGETTVSTNGAGSAGFSFMTAGAPAGSFVTATATSAGGDTSEFSNALLVESPGQVRFSAPSYSTTESGSLTLTLERINGTAGAVSVDWSVDFGSAGPADIGVASGVATFAAADSTETIVIPITADALDEGLESFNVLLSNPTNGLTLAPPSLTTVHITDDDPPVTGSIADASLSEGNSGTTALTFNVTLSAPSGLPVTLDYVTSNGTAIAGSDYAAAAGTVTFAPGETSKSITIQLTGDTAIELDETFTVTLSNPAFVTITDGTATGTIVNDDGPPSITIDDVAIVEGDAGTSTALFTVTLSGPTGATVTVDWSTSAASAEAGVDYESASGTITFPPSDTSGIIAVTIHGDTLVEDNETFFVDLSGPSNATLGDAQGGGTIADDDGTPALSVNDPAVVEGVAATFTVTLAPASALPVTVAYATSDLSATDGADYSGAANTLTFSPGETAKTVDVSTLGDILAEGVEDLRLTLSAPSGATLGDAIGTATILDDDGEPRVTIGNAATAEGNAGNTLLTFTIDLSHASASAIDVSWATTDGTASAGSDFTATGGTIPFAPGETSKTVTVQVTGDTLVEPDETFFVVLTGATNAVVTDGEGAGTITNDDGAVTVSIADLGALEGTGGATTFSFSVTLSAASADPVSVQWASADGTATSGSDYTAGAGSLLFAPGDVSETISISVAPDNAFEPDETFAINLLAATQATIGDAQAAGTILNDDLPPAVPSLSVSPASIVEGNAGSGSLVFAVQLDIPTLSTVTVSYATGGGSATADADYVATAGTLTFAPGQTAQTVDVAVIGDALVEGNETLVMTLSAPANATMGTATATGTIVDDDSAPVVPSISIAPASVVEGHAGSASLVFAVLLDTPTTTSVAVSFASGGGSAIADVDYATATGTLTFAPGVTSQNVIVAVIGDGLIEGNETLVATLSAPVNATLGTATATGTIVDDDSAPATPSISIAPASAVEGNAGSASLVFTVQLDTPTTASVAVSFATGGGSATAGVDYAASSGTLTFAPGLTSQSVVVPVIGDALIEGNETVVVTLSAPVNATLGTTTASGTIVDDDAAPSLPAISIGDVTRAEGDAGATIFAFPVTLHAPPALAVSAAWTIVAGTAAAGADFAAASGTVVFAPGMISQTITVAVHGDEAQELDETFSVQLSTPVNGTIADGTAGGTIRNDDERLPATPSLHASAATLIEGTGGTSDVLVTLTLTSRAPSGASVRWMTRGATATAGTDFVEASGVATFGTSTKATIALSVIGDGLDEAEETFVVELFDAEGATLSDRRAVITIADDDVAAPARAIVLAVGSLRGESGSRFGTAVQMVNLGDVPAAGSLVIHPAGQADAAADVSIPYALAPRELRAWADLLAENGLTGLATLDILPASGAMPRLTVRIYDDGSGHGTTGFTLPVVMASDALQAGEDALLVAPDDPLAMRFNVGVRVLDEGAAMTIEVRDRTGVTRHATFREFSGNWFSQTRGSEFAGIDLQAGDYLAIHITRGRAILYGASVDNATNDPSVQVAAR